MTLDFDPAFFHTIRKYSGFLIVWKTLLEDAHSRVQDKRRFRDRARRESPQADSLFLIEMFLGAMYNN